jgi:replicative DNA helicase
MTTTTQRIVLGAAMNKSEWAQQVWERLTPDEHFNGPDHDAAQAAYTAWQKEKSNDPQVVLLTLQALGLHRRYSGSNLLDMHQQSYPASDGALRMAIGQLEEDRQREQVMRLSERLVGLATNPEADLSVDVSALAGELAVAVQTRVNDPMAGTLTLQQLLDMDFPQHGEVVPGLFKARTRVVLTGPEGRGKSEMIYQIAMGAARGIQPFSTEVITPQRVLIVDAENEHVDLQKRLKRINGLYDGIGASPVGDNLRIQDALGWNLLDPRDAAHLFALVRSFMPDLMVIGPVYQIMGGDGNDAETVRRFMRVVDQCRQISDTAVLTEAHAGHGESGSRNGWRPSGSSLWLRWPDLGIGLSPADDEASVMQLVRWRGDRIENHWPEAVRRGGLLPWTETE